jgi:hypothetical protein
VPLSHYIEQGLSKRAIARKLRISRDTAAQYGAVRMSGSLSLSGEQYSQSGLAQVRKPAQLFLATGTRFPA